MSSRPLPEILAPVGDFEMCKAAVHAGADAIYVGMPNFNARGRAPSLTIEQLAEIIQFCHLYGVRVCVAFNILIFQEELAELPSLIKEVAALNPDAFIVQDIGLVRLVRELAPHVEVHASTQMTVTSAEAIQATQDLGIQRYVLGRENSIEEMRKIRAKTTAELEVFVHGALCVSYSGQCLTSESMGGRSANRGQCAQSCRLPYELIVDGEVKPLGDKRYLVSPQDLCSIDEVPALVEAGIDCFKIEGRLKSPEYVTDSVRRYVAERDRTSLTSSRQPKEGLSIVYSRGLFSGWMHGVDHQQLVPAKISNHHGLEIGSVKRVSSQGVVISSSSQLHPGDGVLFRDSLSEKECGSPLYTVTKSTVPGEYLVTLKDSLTLSSLRPGFTVYLNSSPTYEQELKQLSTNRALKKRVPVTIKATGTIGHPLTVECTDRAGRSVSASSEVPLEKATKRSITEGLLEDELSALGDSPFFAERFLCTINEPVFIHHRTIKELRRTVVQALISMRMSTQVKVGTTPIARASSYAVKDRPILAPSTEALPQLTVLVRDPSQLAGISAEHVHTAYLDFEHGASYEDALAKLRSLGIRAGIATTRIYKPTEQGHLLHIKRLHPDVALVRNLGALEILSDSGIELLGDFSLNVTNDLSASWFLDKGLQRLCPSYDLNAAQLESLIRVVGGAPFEVTVHQYMPAFHMEHCVFAAFLSTGKTWRDCGRPCEKHRVALRDREGREHPLKPDAECRNTMFNGVAQSAASIVPNLINQGVRFFRLEALYESASELEKKISSYSNLLRGVESALTVKEKLGLVEKVGVTDGQLLNIRTYQDRKKVASTEPLLNW